MLVSAGWPSFEELLPKIRSKEQIHGERYHQGQEKPNEIHDAPIGPFAWFGAIRVTVLFRAIGLLHTAYQYIRLIPFKSPNDFENYLFESMGPTICRTQPKAHQPTSLLELGSGLPDSGGGSGGRKLAQPDPKTSARKMGASRAECRLDAVLPPECFASVGFFSPPTPGGDTALISCSRRFTAYYS